MTRSLLLFATAAALMSACLASRAAGLADDAARGRQLFLHGSSSIGNPVVATVGKATRLPGSAAACAGCHGRDGSGRREGGTAAPDIRWPTLSAPGKREGSAGRLSSAYDPGALARTLTQGLDASGNPLSPAMPRYELYDQDLADLLAYLQRMHEVADPGVEPGRLVIGTLLPLSGLVRAQGEALRALIEHRFSEMNARGGLHGRTLVLEVEDSMGEDAPERIRAMAGRALALVGPFAPRHRTLLLELAGRERLPVIGPVMASEASATLPWFSALPSARHLVGALASHWMRLPESDRGTLHVVLGERSDMRELQASLRSALPEGANVEFLRTGTAELSKRISSPVAPGAWWLFGTDPSTLAGLNGGLHGQRILLPSPAMSPGAGSILAGAATVVVGAPLLPPVDDPDMRSAERVLRERGIPVPPAVILVQLLRGTAVLEEAVRRAGREISRERLVSALEDVHGLAAPGGPISFGRHQRAGARGAALFTMDPASGRLTPLRAWEPAL